MSVLSAKERAQLRRQSGPYGLADQILGGIADYEFDVDSVADYDERVKAEIAAGVADLRSIPRIRVMPHLRPSAGRMRDVAVNGDDAVERDQSVWGLVAEGPDAVESLITSVRSAPTDELAISALLALHKVAHHAPERVAGFLEELAGDQRIELAEWARLSLHEMAASLPGGTDRLAEPVSERPFEYDPAAVFDVTMPLVFQCEAYTRVGPLTLHTSISPTWFSSIFGRAMACVRRETFPTNLVLEKLVEGLHEDGSPHFEHFPFSGRTDQVARGVSRHNYWAHLYRPFYTSGRTEIVSRKRPVIQGVPMTFCRVACTYTPDRYRMDGRPVPESVRGIFFGYGHIAPRVLVENRFEVKAGDFQLSSKRNPATGRPANTYFYGTFFGKMSDWDGDGRLDMNTRPTHCDALGRLDYRGDGAMTPDPVRPGDWGNVPQDTECATTY